MQNADLNPTSDGQRNTTLMDITEIVDACAESLSFAEPFVCNSKSFSLHDAMAATHLTDRKMDCCEIPVSLVAPYGRAVLEQEENKMVFPRPIPTGLQDPFSSLSWDELSIRHVAFIGLELISRMDSLMSGASVGESTFTYLYSHAGVLHDMKERLFPGDKVDEQIERLIAGNAEGTSAQFSLFAASLALVDITDVIRGIVQNADIYEEEDFVANTNLIPLYSDHGKIDSRQVLEGALRLIKKTEDSKSDEVQIASLLLGFLSEFLSACSTLGKLTEANLLKTVQKAKNVVQMAVQKLEKLRKLLDRQHFASILDNDAELQAVLRHSFDSYVSRPLAGNSPVRKVFFRKPRESIDRILKFTSEIEWSLCNLLLHGNSLARIQRMLERVSQSDVNILSRSLIILNLYFDEKLLGQHSLRQLVIDDFLQWMSVPDTFLTDEHVDAFMGRIIKPVYDTLKLFTLNRNRQRAFIEVVMLPEWASLLSEAHLIDSHFRQLHGLDKSAPPFLSQYIMSILLRLMDRFVASGLEVGLFCNHVELSFAYWYRDFLLSALMNNLTSMKRARLLAMQPPESNSTTTNLAGQRGQRGKKKNHKPTKAVDGSSSTPVIPTLADKEDDFALSVIGLTRNLCRGTLRFIASLKQAGILRDPQYEFTSLEHIFKKRFQIFEIVRQPPALSYEHFVEGTDFSRVSQDDLQETTVDWLQSCKTTVEQLLATVVALSPTDACYATIQASELRSLQKVCIGNCVYIEKLRQKCKINISTSSTTTNSSVSTTSVEFDFGTHDKFCILKVS